MPEILEVLQITVRYYNCTHRYLDTYRWHFQPRPSDCSDDHHQHSLVLRCTDSETRTYERVGILQEWDRSFHKEDGSEYGLFLGEGIEEEKKITLV